MKSHPLPMNQSGVSLIEAVIALGALGFVLLVSLEIFQSMQVANEGVSALEDAVSLKQMLLLGVDCQRTLFDVTQQDGVSKPHPSQPNKACSKAMGSNYLEIVAKIPTPISSETYSGEYAIVRQFKKDNLEYAAPHFKNIFVRASCVDCAVCISGKTIKVEYQPRKKAVSVLDYLKRKSGQDSDMKVLWKDLFSGVPFGCVAP